MQLAQAERASKATIISVRYGFRAENRQPLISLVFSPNVSQKGTGTNIENLNVTIQSQAFPLPPEQERLL